MPLHVRYHRLDSIAAWRDGVSSLDRRRDRFDSRHRPQAKIEFQFCDVELHPLAPLWESLAVSRDTLRRFGQSFFWFAKWVLAPLILGTLVIAGGVAVYQRGIDFDTFLNYFALGLLIFVVVTLFYGIIAIHDVPYEIAKKRDHPHQDAIHAAGWVSLFTLHALGRSCGSGRCSIAPSAVGASSTSQKSTLPPIQTGSMISSDAYRNSRRVPSRRDFRRAWSRPRRKAKSER